MDVNYLKATQEELDVLRLLAAGLSVKQAAIKLCIVKNAVYKRLGKLYARNHLPAGNRMIVAIVRFIQDGGQVDLVIWQPGGWVILKQNEHCFRENIGQK